VNRVLQPPQAQFADRRRLLKGMGSLAALPMMSCIAIPMNAAADPPQRARVSAAPRRWPQPIGSPVLESLRPVIAGSRDVSSNVARISEVAGWMAYEELPLPNFALPFDLGKNQEQAVDFTLVADSIDFAFTDFATDVKFQVDFGGRHWSDSDAMFACLKRAIDQGVPVLDGAYLAKVTAADLRRIFRGNIEMPMAEERAAVLREVGGVLNQRYGGRFSNFVQACSPRCYDGGNGLVEKLVAEFPRFDDVSSYDGHEVRFYKLAQLGVWMLYSTLRSSGIFKLEDPQRMTAFADYIVPAALRLLGILEYSPSLESAIQQRKLIARDSRQEIEIRAHTLYATALLAEDINKLRPANLQIIIPQVDARLWTHYHTTFWPHHLTRTIMY
jgi:hypothetical protein